MSLGNAKKIRTPESRIRPTSRLNTGLVAAAALRLVRRECADEAALLLGRRDLDLVPVRRLEHLAHLLHEVPLRLLRVVGVHRLGSAAAPPVPKEDRLRLYA